MAPFFTLSPKFDASEIYLKFNEDALLLLTMVNKEFC